MVGYEYTCPCIINCYRWTVKYSISIIYFSWFTEKYNCLFPPSYFFSLYAQFKAKYSVLVFFFCNNFLHYISYFIPLFILFLPCLCCIDHWDWYSWNMHTTSSSLLSVYSHCIKKTEFCGYGQNTLKYCTNWWKNKKREMALYISQSLISTTIISFSLTFKTSKSLFIKNILPPSFSLWIDVICSPMYIMMMKHWLLWNGYPPFCPLFLPNPPPYSYLNIPISWCTIESMNCTSHSNWLFEALQTIKIQQ